MVKIVTASGREEKFDSKDVEKDLKAAGLPERVAEEIAERVEDRVQDGWTQAKVKEETDLELKRMQEDLNRAHKSYIGESTMERETVTGERSAAMGERESTTGERKTHVECRTVEG